MSRVVLSVVFVALGASPAAAFGTADEAEPHDPEIVSPENLARAGEAAEGAASTIELANQLVEAHSALSELDRALDEHLRDDHNGPDVPSSCATTSPTCAQCFAAAYREVNFTRITLERLRTIHSRTLAFIRAAEAVGDTTSGIHGVAGLSWQYAKVGVEEGKRSFNQTSRAKYEGLIQNMRRALDMVAACERDNFHNPDWYSRFGFIYYDFVRDAYAIHDD
jgi:hypothetical protein